MQRREEGKGGEGQKMPTADKPESAKNSQKADERLDESLEQIGKYRGMAQQNSMEAVKAAQDRYQKAKQTGAHGTESAGS